MQLSEFLTRLLNNPLNVSFNETIAVIDENYAFTAAAFRNGELLNEAGQNTGSCKIFSFAQLNKLTKEQTLQCFGNYYRIDVLQYPESADHQNIRNFIHFGWNGIEFFDQALTKKNKLLS